jgi:hypothetical protein
MRTEGFGHLNIFKDPTENRALDVSSCGTVPQPTAPSHVPHRPIKHTEIKVKKKYFFMISYPQCCKGAEGCLIQFQVNYRSQSLERSGRSALRSSHCTSSVLIGENTRSTSVPL